jgi:hypothetical protein
LGGQDFQGYEPVEMLLAGLIYRSHASLAQQFDDFKLWELGSKFFRLRRNEGRRGVEGCWNGTLRMGS